LVFAVQRHERKEQTCRNSEGHLPGFHLRYSLFFRLLNIKESIHVCHDADAPVGRVKLTTWGHTVLDLPGIVIPGEPDNSELVFRIDGRVGVGRMPPYGNPLNQNQINGIRTWIAEGAKQN